MFLVIEEVASALCSRHVAYYSDKIPSVHWVQLLVVKSYTAAMQLILALSLHLQMTKTSLFTVPDIKGQKNSMTNVDIPSHYLGARATGIDEMVLIFSHHLTLSSLFQCRHLGIIFTANILFIRLFVTMLL